MIHTNNCNHCNINLELFTVIIRTFINYNYNYNYGQRMILGKL